MKKHHPFFHHVAFYPKLALLATALVIFSLIGIVIYFFANQPARETKPAISSSAVSQSVSHKTAYLQQKRAAARAHARAAAMAKTTAVRAWSKRPPLPAGQKIAFLTFDDGPSPYTPAVLNVLDHEKVKATFFIAFMGTDNRAKRSWVKMEHDSGHMVGEHSWTHKYTYIYANEHNFMVDFLKMKQILTEITGNEPKLFRFPGGATNTVSVRVHGCKPIIPALLGDLAVRGMTPFDWTAGGEDAQVPRPVSPQHFAADIVRDVGRQEHPIILMHDTNRLSVETLPYLITQLRTRGYRFATLKPTMRPVLGRPASPQQPACSKRKHEQS
ncbi:MAG: polysaccharide deacetylase family protein [Sporolactobacillus sp.]|nr:polysaccharide deacetylase family protein [Sporolactobacillus sp.]